MIIKWWKRRSKSKRLKLLAEKKHKDWQRPIRISKRLQLRIEKLGDEAKASVRTDPDKAERLSQRMTVLLNRMRRVRDFQIKEWGH